MPDTQSQSQAAMAQEVQETRRRIATHLAALHHLNLALAQDSRSLKAFTTMGQPIAEIEIAAEMLEQYMTSTEAFLENMRGRFEARLGLLRRGEPRPGPDAEVAHGAFWLAYSRLSVALRRMGGQGSAALS
jgi:hypothetical protein